MEQHCRGEYERSFLLEFQEVREFYAENRRLLPQPLVLNPFVSVVGSVAGTGSGMAGEGF